MPKIPFPKTATTLEEQMDKLVKRGLTISDRDHAEHYLRYISYYRLVGYGLALEEFDATGKRLDRFKAGTSFNDLLNLYIFDRHLRALIMDAIERIEISARTAIVYEMSHTYDPHWYMNSRLFMAPHYPTRRNARTFNHRGFISEVEKATQHTARPGTTRETKREKFIQHYYDTYSSPSLPPSWMIAEVLSMGVWSRAYEGIKSDRDRKNISRRFDLSMDTMQSWLHSLVYLRNLCAHHGRVYSRKLVISPKRDKNIPATDLRTFYAHAAVIHWLLEIIAPNSGWVDRLDTLMKDHSVELSRLGFDDSWRSDPFWNSTSK